jgi:hypothetical protein
MKTLNLFNILLAFTILTAMGCDPYARRDCPGFNYEISQWVDYDAVDTIAFMNEDGEELVFIKDEVQWSEPTVQGVRGATEPSEVTCEMYAIYTYQLATAGVELEIEYHEREGYYMGDEFETVLFSVKFNDTDSMRLINGHGFQIEPLMVEDRVNLTLFDELEMNGRDYTHVIRSVRDTTRASANPIFDFWEVFIARGEGIIKMKNRNGVDFFRLH